jgi:hypothetical protein
MMCIRLEEEIMGQSEENIQELLNSYHRKGPAGHAAKVGLETYAALSVIEGAYRYNQQQQQQQAAQQNFPAGDYGYLPAQQAPQPSLVGSIVSSFFRGGILAHLIGGAIGIGLLLAVIAALVVLGNITQGT